LDGSIAARAPGGIATVTAPYTAAVDAMPGAKLQSEQAPVDT